MARNFRELTMTPAVLARQKKQYGTTYAVESTGEPDVLGPAEREFIESRDTFYMATVTETGWPYVQHRGGAAGFLRVIDERTIAFADLRGNRQLISTGNVAANDRVALILMDYPQQMRLKILGRVTIEEAKADSPIAAAFDGQPKDGTVERFFVIRVDGFDWNCPQHITPRYTEAEVTEYVAPLRKKIAALEAELAALRSAGS